MPNPLSHTGTQPSTAPMRGATVAVSAMTPAQLAVLMDSDVTVGAVPNVANQNNGLRARLADGRSSGWQDYEDALFAINTIAAAA